MARKDLLKASVIRTGRLENHYLRLRLFNLAFERAGSRSVVVKVPDADFCVEALNEAIHRFGPPDIMNSDLGSQFASFVWTDCLRRSGVRISMDGKVRYLDNIFIERLLRTLKYECVYLHAWETGAQVRAGIRKWMEFYNHRRPHKALGSRPPAVVYSLQIEVTQPDPARGKKSLESTRSCPENGEHLSVSTHIAIKPPFRRSRSR